MGAEVAAGSSERSQHIPGSCCCRHGRAPRGLRFVSAWRRKGCGVWLGAVMRAAISYSRSTKLTVKANTAMPWPLLPFRGAPGCHRERGWGPAGPSPERARNCPHSPMGACVPAATHGSRWLLAAGHLHGLAQLGSVSCRSPPALCSLSDHRTPLC